MGQGVLDSDITGKQSQEGRPRLLSVPRVSTISRRHEGILTTREN